MSKKILGAALFALLSQNLFAQDAPEAKVIEGDTLESFVMTGYKTPTKAKESAQDVQVIGKDILDRSHGKDISQILTEQAGIIVNSAMSNPGKDKNLFMRGASSKYTLILIDGVPVNDPSSSGGTFDIRTISTDQIERIEVLKGGQSALYGTDAIAGIINIITKKGKGKKVNISGKAAYGSLNTINSQLAVNGEMKKFTYHLGGSLNSTDGLSEALDLNNDSFDKDGFQQTALNANFEFRPKDGINIRPFVRYTDFAGNYDAGAFTDAENTYDAALLQTGVNAQYKNEKINANLKYAYTDAKRTFSSAWGVYDYNGTTHNIDLFANYELNEDLNVLVGVASQMFMMADSSTTIINPSINILSPYASVVYRGVKNLSLEAGYRANMHSLYGYNSNVSFATSYLINKQVKLYGNVSTAFKAPTLSELYGPWGGNPDLKAENGLTYEIGTKTYLMEEKLVASIAYFSRNISNLIAYDFVAGYMNRDEQNDYGIEFQLSYKHNDKLSFNATYDFVDGLLTDNSIIGMPVETSNLIRRPKHRIGLGAVAKPTKGLTVQAYTQFNDTRQDLFFDPMTFASSEVRLKAYWLLNAYVSYKTLGDKLTVFADFKNITNTQFSEVHGYSSLGFNALLGVQFNISK